MTVVAVRTAVGAYPVTGSGYAPEGAICQPAATAATGASLKGLPTATTTSAPAAAPTIGAGAIDLEAAEPRALSTGLGGMGGGVTKGGEGPPLSGEEKQRMLELLLPGVLANDASLVLAVPKAVAPDVSTAAAGTGKPPPPLASPLVSPVPGTGTGTSTRRLPVASTTTVVVSATTTTTTIAAGGLAAIPQTSVAAEATAVEVGSAQQPPASPTIVPSSSAAVAPAPPSSSAIVVPGAAPVPAPPMPEAGTAPSSVAPTWQMTGDPTEGALLTLGMKAGIASLEALTSAYPRISTVPFECEWMLVVTYQVFGQ